MRIVLVTLATFGSACADGADSGTRTEVDVTVEVEHETLPDLETAADETHASPVDATDLDAPELDAPEDATPNPTFDPAPQAVVVAANPHQLVVDDRRLYWSVIDDDNGHRILSCPLVGCDIDDAYVLARDIDRPIALTVDAQHVYWVTDTGRLQRTARGGGGGVKEMDQAHTPEAGGSIQSDGEIVVWTTGASGFATHAAGPRRAYFSLTWTAFAFGQTDTAFLLTDGYYIYAFPKGNAAQDGEAQVIDGYESETGDYLAVTCDATHIYWRHRSRGLIACPITGCSPELERVVAPHEDTPLFEMRSDGEHVYWPSRDGGSIVKTSIATGLVSSVPTLGASDRIYLTAVQGDYLYFIDTDRRAIGRVGK